MEGTKILSGIVLVLLAAWVLGAIASLAVANDLFTASDWQAAAGGSLVVFALGLLGFISLGRAWQRWQRTPYW